MRLCVPQTRRPCNCSFATGVPFLFPHSCQRRYLHRPAAGAQSSIPRDGSSHSISPLFCFFVWDPPRAGRKQMRLFLSSDLPQRQLIPNGVQSFNSRIANELPSSSVNIHRSRSRIFKLQNLKHFITFTTKFE